VLDCEIIGRRMPKRLLWQAHPVTSHIGSVQMKNAHAETFDAPNFSFDVSNRRHGWLTKPV